MPSGSLDPHFDQALRLGCGPPDDGEDCGRGQPGVLGVEIPYPQSDHHRLPGRPGRLPGDLEQARGGKNTTPGSSGAPTPARWPGPARRGRSGGCGPNRWAAAGSGCSERPRGYFSITLSDTAGQRERAPTRPIVNRHSGGTAALSRARRADQDGAWRASSGRDVAFRPVRGVSRLALLPACPPGGAQRACIPGDGVAAEQRPG
jgi:hypothetical protein